MSASQASALSAIAFQLAAALYAYERDISLMAAGRMDPELYQAIGRRMDEMRTYAASLPRLSVAWVDVLIRHFELTHGVWQVQQDKLAAAQIARLHEDQRQACARLRKQCLHMLVQEEKA
jgi:hypothetical protein